MLKGSGHRLVIMADRFKMASVWFMWSPSDALDKMEGRFQFSKLRLILGKC